MPTVRTSLASEAKVKMKVLQTQQEQQIGDGLSSTLPTSRRATELPHEFVESVSAAREKSFQVSMMGQ